MSAKNFKLILPTSFVLFVSLICLLLFTSEIVNGRFWLNDFKVYYLAAKSLISGSQVYGTHFGLDSGFYKYSPFVLLLFAPFTLLPYKIACIIYYFAIVFFVLWSFKLVKEFMQTYFYKEPIKNEAWLLSIVFIFCLNLLYRELHLGNTNILLLLLLLLCIKHIVQSRHFVSGVLFGLVILFKPFFLIIALPILFHKKWKLIWGGIAFIVLQSLIFFLIFGWNQTLILHTEWLKTMLDHSTSFPSNNNIDYLVSHFIHANLPSSFQYAILIGACFLYIVLFWTNNYFHREKKTSKQRQNTNFIFECFILIALLPSIINTDTEHFLYSLPIITMLVYFVIQQKRVLPIICLCILFLLYGTNSNDIVGKTIGDFFDNIGALGLSNLGLIGMTIVVFWRKKDTNQVPNSKYQDPNTKFQAPNTKF